jgi:predicted deacylase
MTSKHIEQLDLGLFERGKIHKLWFDIATNPFGREMSIPLMIARGDEGPTLGLTAALHGNELNGIPVIHRVFRELDLSKLHGTIIGVPVVNVLSFTRRKRRFIDGMDLNHIMPGKQKGSVSEIYAYRFFNGIVRHFDILLDLHTASFGRINSYYIRADLTDETTSELARLQQAQIIVNNFPSDGTLRGAASEIGIPAITLEVGNPNTYQRGMIRSGATGLYNAMIYLGMIGGEIDEPAQDAVICDTSYWIYTDKGGLLNVLPTPTDLVEEGQHIASQYDIFGDSVEKYLAPEHGIVIGKSVSPVNMTGGRILHLGLMRNQ